MYTELEPTKLDTVLQQISFLVITATNVETKELHRKLRPFPGYGSRLITTQGAHTYYLGTLGDYAVVHTQCEMGSVSAGASLAAASHGIEFWAPRAVLMVGIAFGTDKKTQGIGDVLVARSVIAYDIRREGKLEIVRRGVIPPSGAVLLNRFKNQPDWKYSRLDGGRSRIIPADMLSGV